MTPANTDKLQNAAIMLFLGLLLTPAIGFGTGIWVTRSSADRKTSDALLDARASICVAQFDKSPNRQERLRQYKGLDYNAKTAFFEKGGWSRMPGEEKAQDAVTQACAGRIEALAQDLPA